MSEKQAGGIEEKMDFLLLKVQRLEDVNAIQNLVSKDTFLYEARRHEERLALFAQKTPGVTVEISGRGVFEGLDGARKTIVDSEEHFDRLNAKGLRMTYPDLELPCDTAGMLNTQLVGTPMIEVAGDGKTAQGIWIILDAWARTEDRVGAPEARWAWSKIAADFVKEDGEWRIWHFVKNPLFMCAYHESWVDRILKVPPLAPQKLWEMHGAMPDKPSSAQYRPYSLTREPALFPPPPEAYETFDDVEPYSY
jgi:hypothetical protein